tara:strand:- start:278 stop:592 length:315 start_codon:yes stop_codon:yes gene_type:complete
MSCRIDELPVKFRDSLINNFNKNMTFVIKQLYKEDSQTKKIELINRFINRINGYEGDIILKYNKYLLFTLLNNLNTFIKRNRKTIVLKRVINKHITLIMGRLNE